MHFKYKAMNGTGRMLVGKLDADNPEDLEVRLRRMDLDLISYRLGSQRFQFNSGQIPRQDLINFCFYMEQLLRAGVPLLQGLEDMRDSMEPSRFRDMLASLIEDVQAGRHLSDSMRRFPKAFDTVFVNLVHVGEESGELTNVFKHLTDSLKWQDEIMAQTKRLLIYPAFSALVIFSMVFFMMFWLVPELVVFMKNVTDELPPQTKMLVAVSEFVQQYWLALLLTPPSLLIALWLAMFFNYRLRVKVDDLKLRIWIIGPIFKKIILARFASLFALMYEAGITVLESLEVIEKTAGNLAIEEALQQVRAQIADGSSMSAAFAQARLFPPLVLRMVNIGESTGDLDTAMRNVSYFYDRDVREAIGKLQAMIEPIMILVLGGIMAWLILSVLGPIYDIISQVGKTA